MRNREALLRTRFYLTVVIGFGMAQLLLPAAAYANATDLTIGDIASLITQSFTNLAKLITASSYLAGLGFSIGAIMKFKQHKDNPTQIPVGTPVALLFIASALLFLPSILGITGQTIFGQQGVTAGPLGTVFLSGS